MCVCHVDAFCGSVIGGLLVFFFKQKTAYEMRISDWSSDVCSSDLARYSQQAPDVRFTLVSADGGIDFTEANLDLAIFWTDGAGEHEGVALADALMVTVAGPASESETRIAWPGSTEARRVGK